jgi:hypothetical protein
MIWRSSARRIAPITRLPASTPAAVAKRGTSTEWDQVQNPRGLHAVSLWVDAMSIAAPAMTPVGAHDRAGDAQAAAIMVFGAQDRGPAHEDRFGPVLRQGLPSDRPEPLRAELLPCVWLSEFESLWPGFTLSSSSWSDGLRAPSLARRVVIA